MKCINLDANVQLSHQKVLKYNFFKMQNPPSIQFAVLKQFEVFSRSTFNNVDAIQSCILKKTM